MHGVFEAFISIFRVGLDLQKKNYIKKLTEFSRLNCFITTTRAGQNESAQTNTNVSSKRQGKQTLQVDGCPSMHPLAAGCLSVHSFLTFVHSCKSFITLLILLKISPFLIEYVKPSH